MCAERFRFNWLQAATRCRREDDWIALKIIDSDRWRHHLVCSGLSDVSLDHPPCCVYALQMSNDGNRILRKSSSMLHIILILDAVYIPAIHSSHCHISLFILVFLPRVKSIVLSAWSYSIALLSTSLIFYSFISSIYINAGQQGHISSTNRCPLSN